MKYTIPFLFDYIFPTGYVPNASMPEITIINYISSFHTKNVFGSTLVEAFPETFHNIFNDRLGTTPNSLSQFFYNAGCYSDNIEIYEDSVFHGSRSFSKFIYPIKPAPILLTFFGDGIHPKFGKQNGNYFWKYIPESTMEKIINRQGFILIDYTMEPAVSREQYETIHKTLSYSRIPDGQIILAINSFNAKELYETWFPPTERKLCVLDVPFCLDHSSWLYNVEIANSSGKCMNINDFLNTKQHKRKKYFLMKSKQIRPHRMYMLYNLEKRDVLNKGNWSYLSDFLHLKEDGVDKSIVDRLKTKIPHNLEEEDVNYSSRIDGWSDKDFSTYLNSYFEVCLETIGEGASISFTEKIFKPLINFHPFFLVSSCGSLNKLKELGFKTFSPFIDESYDMEPHTFKRTEMIAEEVKRLCAMSEDEIYNWYWGMEDILIHNHNKLLEYSKNTFGLDAIKKLYDITHT